MKFQPARIVIASLAIVAFHETGLFAAEPDSPPHVDASGVNMQPAYPATALPTQETGAPVLGVAVTADGKAARVSLIDTSGFNDLDAAAIAVVLGWKFVPAMKGGSPVDGTTMVKLIFQPPDTSPDTSPKTAGAAPAAPLSKQLYTDPLVMSADDGKKNSLEYPVPCGRGAFEGTVSIGHDAKPGGELAGFQVQLHAGTETVRFAINHFGARLVGAQLVRFSGDRVMGADNYNGSGETGVGIPISVGWDSAKVTGNGGRIFGEHEVVFAKIPEKLELAVSSGDVTITHPSLVCVPDHTPLPGMTVRSSWGQAPQTNSAGMGRVK